MDPQAIDVWLNGVEVAKASAPHADRGLVSFESRLVEIIVEMHVGSSSASVMTNDLSHDYVHENSAYAT